MARTGPVFVVTGVPGAGKSSVARALVGRFRFGLHLPVDDLREWVVSGIAHPVPTWTAETGRQFGLARRAATEVTRLYSEVGFAVALDDVLSPEDAAAFDAALPGTAVHKVALLPRLDVALARNAARTDKAFDPLVLADAIRRRHRAINPATFRSAGWFVRDTSAETVEETVTAILKRFPPDASG